MKKGIAGYVRKFTHTSRAWYGKVCLEQSNYADEVMFGLYHPGGGTIGEMSMRWYSLSGKAVPKLECFDDAFFVLGTFRDVISRLADRDNDNTTPEEFQQILLACGFDDETNPVNPHVPNKEASQPDDATQRLVTACKAARAELIGHMQGTWPGSMRATAERIDGMLADAIAGVSQ